MFDSSPKLTSAINAGGCDKVHDKMSHWVKNHGEKS
jgi:hypothetical protein